MTTHYRGPSAAVEKRRKDAMTAAMADLSDEARAENESRIFNLQAHVDRVGADTAAEIVAALAMLVGEE